jgi:hypothetical protein
MKNTSNIQSVNEFCKNINKGTFGISLVAVTEPKMNKKGNPFFGRVKKATYITNVALGYTYENVVNNRLDRKGLESNFESEKPKGKSWLEFPYLLVSDKDNTQQYLRTTMRKNSKIDNIYLLDGKIVNDLDIINQIKNWLPKSSTSAKQETFGLAEEEQVIIRDFKVENIVSLMQGEKKYTNDIYNIVRYFG